MNMAEAYVLVVSIRNQKRNSEKMVTKVGTPRKANVKPVQMQDILTIYLEDINDHALCRLE